MTAASFHAPGKLLLFGEHSAVFGYPALGTSLDRGLSITATPAETLTIEIVREDDGAEPDPQRSVAQPVPESGLVEFARFLTGLLPDISPARIAVRSDLPISSGFGSSAALCTALARWARPGQSAMETWELAHRIETFFHGTPSGVDTGLTSLGGVKAFLFSATPGQRDDWGGGSNPRAGSGLPAVVELPTKLPPMVVGSVPRTRTTRELVAAVRDALERNPRSVRPILDHLGEIAGQAIELLRTGDDSSLAQLVATLVTAARQELAALPILSETVGAILDAGYAAGALAGKPSGAGAGGAFYLVCPDRETASNVLEAVRRVLPPGGVVF